MVNKKYENKNFQREILELIKNKYVQKNQKLEKLIISLEIYDDEQELTHGILITLPSQNNFFLELQKQV